jgi:hypothetical protein
VLLCECHYSECLNVECQCASIIMLSVIMLASVVILNVIFLVSLCRVSCTERCNAECRNAAIEGRFSIPQTWAVFTTLDIFHILQVLQIN